MDQTVRTADQGTCPRTGHSAHTPAQCPQRVMTIDSAQTGDDLLTALAGMAVEYRLTALYRRSGAAYLRILRAAADLCGAAYADTMTRKEAVGAILENF